MQSRWFARLFFLAVATVAAAGGLGACTRWGQPGPVTPTIEPISSIYVDPNTGSDSTGNGSIQKPYKTMTKAVDTLASSKALSPGGVTIYLSSGDYNAAKGEKFPIVIPTSVTIDGTSYGRGLRNGTFIDGSGEDTLYEHIVNAPARSAYATLEIENAAGVTLNDVYVGDAKLSLPGSATYVSLDNMGTLSVTFATFGVAVAPAASNAGGILDAGGTLTCNSCVVHGNAFGIGALSVPVATASPYATGPSITLNHANGDSSIAAKGVDILTDGSVSVTANQEVFERSRYAYEDTIAPIVPVPIRGAIDFGGGVAQSSGGNVFIGARNTEISVTRRNVTISALDDTWNPGQQRANRNGRYRRTITFDPGASGKNVTIAHDASGSAVTVGPAPVPTPSITPSTSPTPT